MLGRIVVSLLMLGFTAVMLAPACVMAERAGLGVEQVEEGR